MDHALVEDAFLVKVRYSFEFADGKKIAFDTFRDLLSASPDTSEVQGPAWAKLDFQKCPHCTLNSPKNLYCPAALSIADIVEFFSKHPGYAEARCTVSLPDKTIVVQKPLSDILSCLMGLRMATSFCPWLKELRLMARFHEPFSSPYNTVYRATSMYLLKQYFRMKDGKEADWDLEGLKELYEKLGLGNRLMVERLRAAGDRNCTPCSMTVLSVLTVAMTLLFDEHLKVLKELDQG